MGIVFVDHLILNFMMFLSRINMCIENKCCDFHFQCQCCGFAQRFVLVPKWNKLMHCGLFVRASVKEIKREIFEILTARCLNCFLSVKSIALVVFLLVGALAK